MPERLLCYHQLEPEKGITYSRMHVSRLERDGLFPTRVRAGNRVAWLESELDAYLRALPPGHFSRDRLKNLPHIRQKAEAAARKAAEAECALPEQLPPPAHLRKPQRGRKTAENGRAGIPR